MDRLTRALRSAPALLLALAVTTGWADATPAASRVAAATAARAASIATHAVAATSVAPLALAPAPVLGSLASGGSSEPLPDRSMWRPTAVVEIAPAETPKAATKSKPAPKPEPKAAPAPTIVRNHFWIPKLGMSYHVYLFECTRNRPPDNYIYRWGCAGTNNVYILGHAYGVMKPLHDLYVSGGLKVGLVAKYADRKGVVHTYRVTTWRVVDPVDSAWAIASQPVPSMTLQTCVGRDSRYRLNVRLMEV